MQRIDQLARGDHFRLSGEDFRRPHAVQLIVAIRAAVFQHHQLVICVRAMTHGRLRPLAKKILTAFEAPADQS